MGMLRRHANVYENGRFAVKEIFITENDRGGRGGLFSLFPSDEFFSLQATDHYFYSAADAKQIPFVNYLFYPVSLMYMFISENRVFHIKKRSNPERRRPRPADLPPYAACRILIPRRTVSPA